MDVLDRADLGGDLDAPASGGALFSKEGHGLEGVREEVGAEKEGGDDGASPSLSGETVDHGYVEIVQKKPLDDLPARSPEDQKRRGCVVGPARFHNSVVESLCVVLSLCQIPHRVLVLVECVQHRPHFFHRVPVRRLQCLRRIRHRDDTRGDVGEVEVKAGTLETGFVGADLLLDHQRQVPHKVHRRHFPLFSFFLSAGSFLRALSFLS